MSSPRLTAADRDVAGNDSAGRTISFVNKDHVVVTCMTACGAMVLCADGAQVSSETANTGIHTAPAKVHWSQRFPVPTAAPAPWM